MNKKVKKAFRVLGIVILSFFAVVIVLMTALCIYHQCKLKKERNLEEQHKYKQRVINQQVVCALEKGGDRSEEEQLEHLQRTGVQSDKQCLPLEQRAGRLACNPF